MNIEEIREYCLSKPGVTESFPFDETTLVFKVMGKMFCLTNLKGEPGLSLKNDPEKNIRMREDYPFVLPAYHMNKVHWNRITIGSFVTSALLRNWIDESYTLVVNGLTLKLKNELLKAQGND
jgi:predicted DNA-binding protein (MmcQ/YjbR family)